MIEIENVTKRYGDNTVVDDVSLRVEKGQVAVIVGTSGSGKTTLLRMVNRLVEPSEGRILINGHDTRDMPAYQLRRKIGYAIQGHGLFPHRTVAENIATVPHLAGWDRARIDTRVDELLSLFQLEPRHYRDRHPVQLSGGEQQRVGVARALAAEPDVLLMDEPFGALDPIIRAKAQDDLLDIQRKTGVTVLLVTHDMDEAMRLGDLIAVMAEGKVVQYADPATLLVKPATDFVDNLVGTADRPFRLLSLRKVDDVMEPGGADGGEPVQPSTSLREAYANMLWQGREALPVVDASGAAIGQVRLAAISRLAARPA
ncbi:ABC transporter ATP-binding protein [Georhizobium profundi]|uniref:ABC transporter ATP-binding protein n=1 Tax=Georhizobium profundi TaxID=2341112 RepID=A0A3Q8XPG5_9HYPH|nr:ABC transporter ATP-binding protein [Georhizobium profundi]AZN71239.1 ABC transporter ATP-binding protein [Georhizobium profundi]